MEKTHNIYKENNNFYVRKIKDVTVDTLVDNKYFLLCTIKERGYNLYSYIKGSDRIYKNNENKYLILSEDAKKTIDEAIEKADHIYEGLVKYGRKINIVDDKVYGYYDRSDYEIFNLAIIVEDIDKTIIFKFGIFLEEILPDIELIIRNYSNDDKKTFEPLFDSEETIINNPFYISSIKDNDDLLRMQIRYYFSIATKEECAELGHITNTIKLPTLPEEYNKSYVIKADTIKLNPSRLGFKIFHKPNFGMRGYTRKNIILNPYSKTGIDAAKDDLEAISFDDFLKLYEIYDLHIENSKYKRNILGELIKNE